MALFNYANREITAKVVYYGPGVCGKTTSLQYIHERIAPVQRGRLLSLATETDRTIFFDLLPLKLGEIRGFKLRFQLYTVPGQVKYNKTRKLVLQGADAIVFVADSQVNRREKNLDSLRNLKDNLKEQGKDLNDLPLVFAYNKRDLDNILSIDQLNQDLNPKSLPYFPAVATKGVGVMETLEAISKNALQDIEQRLSANTKTEAPEPEAEFSLTDDELLDLTGEEASLDEEAPLDTGSLSLSDDLDTLELDSDLDLGEETLESKPIGYDNTIEVEEFEIQTDTVAHTGTLKESEFFDLKDIEEQALRELDEFIDGNLGDSDFDAGGDFDTGDAPFSFDSFGSDVGDAEAEDTGNGLFDSSASDDSTSGFSFADSGPADENANDDLDFSFSAASLDRDSEPEADDGDLDFSFSASPLGEEAGEDQEGDSGLDFSFSAAPSGQDSEPGDEGLDFSFSAADGTPASEAETAEEEVDFGASLEPDSLLDFTLGDEPGAEAAQPQQSNADSGLEPLELSENDLDFSDLDQEPVDSGDDLDLSFGDDDNVTADADGDFPSFTLPDDEGGEAGESASLTANEDDLVEFTLDEALDASPEPSPVEESAANSDIESLNLSDADLDLSFGDDASFGDEDEEEGTSSLSGLNIPDEESGPPYDFRITDSVRFEMQHSEEISSVTPFEKQLDELSEEMFTAEEEPSRDDFEPETIEDSGDEQFQALADKTKRQLVIAKYFYQQGEIARAKQQTRSHIQAVMMYSLAVETILKAVALKYETCNPSIASLKIILDSIEEETGNTISGRKSVMDNIIILKDKIQMETAYPDQDACELAARICDRFLSTLAEEFLSIDINDLSPILPEPVET